MDKSDLDSFQNIEKKPTRISLANQAPTSPLSGSSSPHQLAHQQSQQVCQVCGVNLKIDSNIIQMSDQMYRQLSTPFGYRDDFETTLCSGGGGVVGAPSVDTDMELSLNANLVGSSTNQGGVSGVTAGEVEPLYRKSIAPYAIFDAVGDSTTTAAQQVESGWSARINATTALFDMMSSNTSIDHPLCEECADLLVNQLDAQCKIVETEYNDYTQLNARLNAQVNNESEIVELEKELAALEAEERQLIEKIQSY